MWRRMHHVSCGFREFERRAERYLLEEMEGFSSPLCTWSET